MQLKPMTESVRSELKTRIKNFQDVSDLLENRIIKGLDLSRAIITRFNHINEDLRGTLFVEARFGQVGQITNFMGCNLSHCNFLRCSFMGTTWMKRVRALNCNFKNTIFDNWHCEFSDFTGSEFCGIRTEFNSPHFKGAKFDESFVRDFCSWLNYDVVLTRRS